MVRIENMATALPPHFVPQSLARTAYTMVFTGTSAEALLTDLLDHCGVENRHFAFPPTYYLSVKSFSVRSAGYIEKAARECLERAGVEPGQIDHLILVTTTSPATPSPDALLVPRLGLRAEVCRWPLFGLVRSPWAALGLALCALALIASGVGILRSRGEGTSFRGAFMGINLFALAVMALLAADALAR